ncbi:MAG: transposase [Breznakia sp.]
MSKRERRTFQEEFKTQIVKLYQNGKRVKELSVDVDYDISEQLIYRWVKQYENSGSFKESDNRSDEENELIRLQKENQQLRMKNDILKQAALIMGRKSK